jgi:CheY-like chemotaxis protein
MSTNPYAGLSVLLVDDEVFAQKFAIRVLQAIGVGEVLTADNGPAALDILRESETVFDLVICDIEMPEMDGYEFARQLRFGTIPKYKEVPILMLTGQDTQKNLRSAQIHRIDGFVVKPPTVDGLRPHLAKALGL